MVLLVWPVLAFLLLVKKLSHHTDGFGYHNSAVLQEESGQLAVKKICCLIIFLIHLS